MVFQCVTFSVCFCAVDSSVRPVSSIQLHVEFLPLYLHSLLSFCPYDSPTSLRPTRLFPSIPFPSFSYFAEVCSPTPSQSLPPFPYPSYCDVLLLLQLLPVISKLYLSATFLTTLFLDRVPVNCCQNWSIFTEEYNVRV